jgi:hypothetical protein
MKRLEKFYLSQMSKYIPLIDRNDIFYSVLEIVGHLPMRIKHRYVKTAAVTGVFCWYHVTSLPPWSLTLIARQ